MKITQLADQVRDMPLRDVLEHYGFDVKREGTTLRAKTERHNIVVTGGRWFDNKANVGGGGAIDLVMHIAGVDFSAACRSLADEFRPLAAGQANLSFPRSSGCQTAPEKKSFEELMALYAVRDDSNWPVARAYLSETRKIDPAIVDELHAVGSIYANDHLPNPSLVFLHRDPHGKVRGATLRDTRHQSAFRPCLGNKLTAWFAVGNFANADRIVAVESPIDALSYYSLFAGRYDALAVVSCAGSTVPLRADVSGIRPPTDLSSSPSTTTPRANAAGRRRGMTPWIGRDSGSRRTARSTRIGTTTWFMSPANSRGSPPHSGYESPLHKCRAFPP